MNNNSHRKRAWAWGMWVLFIVFNMQGQKVEAIVEDPQNSQIEEALQQGRDRAEQRQPPSQLYFHFGPTNGKENHGFLVTKLGSLAVMASHFALRGEVPSPQDIGRSLHEDMLQVVVTVYGAHPEFAKDSYLILKQGNQLIVPTRIRVDGRASRTKHWPNQPAFKAKIVASFQYGTFDPKGKTHLTIFPGSGGEQTFSLDFSLIY